MSASAPERSDPSPSQTKSPFSTVSPADGSKLADVSATPTEEIPEIVSAARAAQRLWSAMKIKQRIGVLHTVKDRTLDRAERIAREVSLEVGKPEIEVLLGEVLPTADVVEYWAQSIEEMLDATEVELDKLTFPGKSGVLFREPRGTVALITPWNYPVALPLRTLVPALLAGNAVVWKPSEISPRSGQLVAELFEGLFPPGVLTLVQGGADVGGALCAAEVDLVVFTGSVATGRKVAHACAERLVPCALELGGKDAAIVLADANLDRAANGVVWGALTNAGQNCAAIERVYVEAAVVQPFVEKVVEAAKSLKGGVDVGPVATAAQRDTVCRHLEAEKAAGGKILFGGDPGKAGYQMGPTVVRVESDASMLMQEETFGPVIPIATVRDAEEAIERVNASRYGLTASLWTRDLLRAERLAHRLRAGVVTINNHAFTGAIPAAPWSGYGESGYGITNSPLALDALTRPRFVLTDRSRARRELWWYPYTPVLRTIALAMAVLRSGTRGIFAKLSALVRLLGAFPKRLLGG